MQIFRLHIKPKGGLAAPEVSFKYCISQKVLGVGWAVGAQPDETLTWDDYYARAVEIYGHNHLSVLRYFYNNLHEGDLIWTRDPKGQYYLAKVLSPWQHRETPESKAADIVNFVKCEILPLKGADEVPGKVTACFRPTRSIQRISDPTIGLYSRQLWNKLSQRQDYDISGNGIKDIFSCLDSEATEDLVFIYLQFKEWIVIPNSRKTDTKAYEYVLIKRDSAERAVVQVKTGKERLNRNHWKGRKEKVFLFQAKGYYDGDASPDVITISPEELFNFMVEQRRFLPGKILHWLDFVNGSLLVK